MKKTLHRLEIMDTPPHNSPDSPVEVFSEVAARESIAHVLVRIPTSTWEEMGSPDSLSVTIDKVKADSKK